MNDMIRRLALILLAVAAGTTGLVAMGGAAHADGSTRPVIDSFTASPSTFYPTLRDGYRDGVGFDSYTEAPQSADGYYGNYATLKWTINVRNTDGGVIASRSGTSDSNDPVASARWSWNGKNQHTGLPVRIGTFRSTLTLTNTETGESDTATRILYAKRALLNSHHTWTWNGDQALATSHSSSCYADKYSYNHTLDLSCWGGHHAVGTSGSGLARNATNVRWSMAGTRGCCDNGRVIKTGTRTSPIFCQVRVKVTNWAEYTVRRVTVSYDHLVQR